jgi:dTDP-4-dehydrorhamnose reductase
MTVLVLGASGMLGHVLTRISASRFETWGTVRLSAEAAANSSALHPDRILGGVAVEDFESVVAAVERARPSTIVNCIGIVKQRREAGDPVSSIEVNALFPHRLALLCRSRGVRLVQISTDCVFSGLRGSYTEDDTPDPNDLYGRTKLLGEPSGEGCLTIRTSMIGWELARFDGLLEWFVAQQSSVRGYRQAKFSGMTTAALSNVIVGVIASPELSGLWHIAGDAIAKYDLLLLLRDRLHHDVNVEPDDSVVIDRTLDGSRFLEATGLRPPPWTVMVDELAHERIARRENS